MPNNNAPPIIEEVNVTYFALLETVPGSPSPSHHMKKLEARMDTLIDTVDDVVNKSQGGPSSKWGNSRLDHLGYDENEAGEAPSSKLRTSNSGASPSRRKSPNKSQGGPSSKWGNSRLDHLGYDGDEDEEPSVSRAGPSGSSRSKGKIRERISSSVKESATGVARKMKNMSGAPGRLIQQYMEQRQVRPPLQEREDKLRKQAIKEMKHVKPEFQRRVDEYFRNQEEKRLMEEVASAVDNINQMTFEQREAELKAEAVDAMRHVKPKFHKRMADYEY